jgi:DNA-binding transcriptional LysR family regulator
VSGGLTISDTLYAVEAAREGVGLAYTFEQLALPHVRSKQLKRVLTKFSPTFPGFYRYYPRTPAAVQDEGLCGIRLRAFARAMTPR